MTAARAMRGAWGALGGAWWASRAVRRARLLLRAGPYDAVRLPVPPRPCAGGERGVRAVLDRLEPTCLERALVLQRWLAAREDRRAVVIGVSPPGPGFRAHAWLEGEPHQGYHEIARVPP